MTDERRWWLDALRLHGGSLSRALRRVFEAIGAELLTGLDRFSQADIVAEVRRRLNPNRWAKELRAAAYLALLTAARDAAADELLRHGGRDARRLFDRTNARLQALVAVVLASDSWRIVVRTLRRDVLRALAVAFALGLAVTAAVSKIATLFSPASLQGRTDRIGETEQHGVLNGGKEAARVVLSAEGYIEGKRWNTMGDEFVRDAHEEAEGQEVAVGRDFTVGGELARYPGDPRLSLSNRIGCRCWSSSVRVAVAAV
jgi:hypothetical protein